MAVPSVAVIAMDVAVRVAVRMRMIVDVLGHRPILRNFCGY